MEAQNTLTKKPRSWNASKNGKTAKNFRIRFEKERNEPRSTSLETNETERRPYDPQSRILHETRFPSKGTMQTHLQQHQIHQFW